MGVASNTPGGEQPWWGRWNPTDAQFPGTTDTLVTSGPPGPNYPYFIRGPLPAPAVGFQYAFVTPATDGGTGPLSTVWSVNTERFCIQNPNGSTADVEAGEQYVASMAVGRPLDTSCPDYTLEIVTEDTTSGDILQVLSSSTVTQANVPLGGFYELSTSYVAPASGGPIGQMLALDIICNNFYETNGVGTVGVFDDAALTVSSPNNNPAAPSGLTATAASSSQINLNWTNNATNQTGFQIDQATSSDFTQGLTTVTVGANVNSYSATGLSAGTTYYYRVRAINANGDSADSSPVSATTLGTLPAAPSGLTATAASSGEIDLSWTNNATNQTGFQIDQATSSDFTQGLTTVTVGANATTYSDTGLASGTTYYFRVRAINNVGDSANASSASATTLGTLPAAPSGLTATAASSSEINLSWTNNATNQTGFQIDQATSSDFTQGLTTVTVGANVTTYSATGLSSDTTYYYRVRATNSNGASANTSTASATTLVTTAESSIISELQSGQNLNFYAMGTSLTADYAGSPVYNYGPPYGGPNNCWFDQTVQWINSLGYAGHVTGYDEAQSGAWSTSVAPYPTGGFNTLGQASQLNWTLNTSAPPDAVFIEFAINDCFTGEVASGVYGTGVSLQQSEANLQTMINQIDAWGTSHSKPISIFVMTMNNAVNVNGNTVGSDRANLAEYYQGYREVAAANAGVTLIDNYPNWVNLYNTNPTLWSQYVPDGLHPNGYGSQYVILPTVENAILNQATQGTLPAAPSGLTATAASSSQINLSWTNNATNQTGFTIDQATSSDFSTGLTTVTVGANVTTYSATGLSAGMTYYYRVRATNANGDSTNTSTASATTAAVGVPVAVPVPDGNFTDAAAYYINSNAGGGLTFTAPMTGTLSGWSISANPSTANGGLYASGGWEPYGAVDSVTSGSGASPFSNNAPWVGDQPSSSYHAFMYYPGEQYNYGSVVGGAQPGASLTMTTTGISAAAVSGTAYTATIEYANVSWASSAVNESANVALNILANGVVVGTGTLSGLAQNSPWTPVTATWTASSAYAGQPIQLQVVATNFLEGPGSTQQWQVPSFGFTDATLTATMPSGLPAAPSGLTATAASSNQINLSWTNNATNQTGFQIDQATSADFTQGLTTVAVVRT